MHSFISGNPLNRRNDNEPIYVGSNIIPPKHNLSISFSIDKKHIKLFIENLYFITMEENGYCYFYPNPKESYNLCRFEWHYDFRGIPYFLRIGLFFSINNSKLENIGCTIEQHEKYKDYKKEIPDCNIIDKELNEIKSFIMAKIEKAKERIFLERSEIFNRIYYIKTHRPVKELTYLYNKSIVVLPTYSSEKNELVTSIILQINAFSFVDCSRFGEEKINLFCAFFSLAVGYIKLSREEKFPLVSPIPVYDRELQLKNIESFYPNCKTELFNFKYLCDEDFDFLNWLYESFDNMKGNDIKKVKNIIFAYYAGEEVKQYNKTLSLVSFVSCMNSISKSFESKYFEENGDRKTIVYYLAERLNIKNNTTEYTDLEKWSKKVYNDHRSSYVHGSNHKFEEYAQNFDGGTFPGLPTALPSNDRIVSKQYEYNNDFEIAQKVVKFMLISCFQDFSGIKFDKLDEYKNIDFSVKSNYQGYIGIPNNGWFRIN
jgi:hypothetical protein